MWLPVDNNFQPIQSLRSNDIDGLPVEIDDEQLFEEI